MGYPGGIDFLEAGLPETAFPTVKEVVFGLTLWGLFLIVLPNFLE